MLGEVGGSDGAQRCHWCDKCVIMFNLKGYHIQDFCQVKVATIHKDLWFQKLNW